MNYRWKIKSEDRSGPEIGPNASLVSVQIQNCSVSLDSSLSELSTVASPHIVARVVLISNELKTLADKLLRSNPESYSQN